jgi:hypothetical protein
MRVLLSNTLLVLLAACSDSGTPTGTCATSADCPDGTCVDGMCETGTADSGTPDTGTIADTGVRDTQPPPSDAPMCEVTETPEMTCNGIDDDCNGYVDDIDEAGDGICDCLAVGVLGSPGPLASSSFQAWLEGRGTSVVRFGTDAATTLSADMLTPYDIVILDQLPKEYSPEEAAALLAYVEDGGGLISMTGHNGSSDLPRANSILAPLGASYVPGLMTAPVEDWSTHPISMGISSVTFRGGYEVSATGTDTVVARLMSVPVGVALERGDGRAFIWGDEWIEYDSEWTTMPMIAQLWANMFAWVGPMDRCVILM